MSAPPPSSLTLGPKVRHQLKFNLSFQCSLVVHVFSMVFAMVIFCKVIFYYGPKLRHWLKLVFDLIFFLLVNDFKSCLQWFYIVSMVQLWHWNRILTYSMPCLLIFHWCLQRCYFIVKLYWNKKKLRPFGQSLRNVAAKITSTLAMYCCIIARMIF